MASHLASMYDLASLYSKAPSDMLGLSGNDPSTIFTRWCYDDICARCKGYDQARRKAQAEPNQFAALVGRG